MPAILMYGMSFMEIILMFIAIMLATWIIFSNFDNWKF